MKEKFEQHRETMTERERMSVWERVKHGGAGAPAPFGWQRFKLAGSLAVGALAAGLVITVFHGERPEKIGDTTMPAELKAPGTDLERLPVREFKIVPDSGRALAKHDLAIADPLVKPTREPRKFGETYRQERLRELGDISLEAADKAAPDNAPAETAPESKSAADRRTRSSDSPRSPAMEERSTEDRSGGVKPEAAAAGAGRQIKKPAAPGERDNQVAVTSPVTAPRPAAGVTPQPFDAAYAPGDELKLGTIVGVVADSTGHPLVFASVALAGTRNGTLTDEQGRFRLDGVAPGSYTLEISMMGYVARSAKVTVLAGSETSINIALSATDVTVLDVTTVRGDAIKTEVEASSTRSAQLNDRLRSLGYISDSKREQARNAMPLLLRTNPVPVYGGTTLPNDEVYDSMFFENYGVNPFIPADEDSFSTFAVDVDAGSYTVMRRYVEGGHLPPKNAVRVEEFVAFFRQDYPSFEDEDFRILLDGAPSPFRAKYHLLRVGIKGREIATEDRLPANLVFVIDTSGSMNRENRLGLVKQALHILLERLRPDDSVAIVEYGSRGRVLLRPTSLDRRDEIVSAIDSLVSNGSTNAEEGLKLGYEMARLGHRSGAINRIILCSDGVANVGRTGPESILEEVRRAADGGIHLSTIGFGMGNYNDELMEQLANRGDGNYHYVDDIKEAKRVFVENLTGTLQTIAKDAKIQVQFNPRAVIGYRLLGFENRDVADRDFRNDAVDAGEIGAGHAVTALYEVKLSDDAEDGPVATVRFRYAAPEDDVEAAGAVTELEASIGRGGFASSFGGASPRLRLDAVVARFAEILRHSYWAKEATIAELVPLARALAGEIGGDDSVREFADLVEKAADLSDKLSPEERAERQSAVDPPRPDR